MSTLFARYNKLFSRQPFLTNALTTGFLFSSGDYLAQYFFPENEKYDYRRTLRACFFGTFVFAPVGNRWYKSLSKLNFPLVNKGGNDDTKVQVMNIIGRVVVDQLFFAPFIAIPLFYSAMPILEFNGSPLEVANERLKQNWWNTVSTNWLFWPFFQIVNFLMVPVKFQLQAVNFFSIGWNCYLSYVLNHSESKHPVEVKNEESVY